MARTGFECDTISYPRIKINEDTEIDFINSTISNLESIIRKIFQDKFNY